MDDTSRAFLLVVPKITCLDPVAAALTRCIIHQRKRISAGLHANKVIYSKR